MAWSFNGSSNYVTLSDDSSLGFPDDEWAISFWVRIPDNSGNALMYICSWLSATLGTNPSMNIFVGQSSFGSAMNNDIQVRACDNDTTDNSSNTGPEDIFDGNTSWTHCLVQHEGSGVVRWYINTALLGQHTTVGLNAISGSGSWYIGASVTPDQYLAGELAEMAKWNTSFNSTEIAGLGNGYSPLFYRTDLQWYLPMIGGIYEEKIQGLTVTNNGSTSAAHPTNIVNPYDSLMMTGVGRV